MTEEQKKPIIYVVTSGDYSDYSINAMFSTEEKAQRFINANTNHYLDYSIEEWDLDSEDMPFDYKYLIVDMTKEGLALKVEETHQSDYWGYYPATKPIVANTEKIMTCVVKAKNVEHAIKIANERRTWAISQGVWGHPNITERYFKERGKELLI